jgi:hypothetical protein
LDRFFVLSEDEAGIGEAANGAKRGSGRTAEKPAPRHSAFDAHDLFSGNGVPIRLRMKRASPAGVII